MIDIRTKIIWNGTIKELGPKFDFLRNFAPFEHEFKNWNYRYEGSDLPVETKKLNIIFIGQTGYGKSTLINKLINNNLFETSDTEACTKDLKAADFHLSDYNIIEPLMHLISFVDMPGIGENSKADEKYLLWYKRYIDEAAVVIYLFRADKRDHTNDEFFFKNVFDENLKNKLICVLSQADKIEPFKGEETISHKQKHKLRLKEDVIRRTPFLRFGPVPIVSVSSQLEFNIDKLKDEIISVLKSLMAD